MRDLTIVSACTANYLWGAWLLVASLRRNRVPFPFRLLQKDFSEADAAMLTQFPDVTIAALPGDDPRNLATRKAEAMLTADSEWVAWMDADCFIVGDITSLTVPPDEPGFCVRYRGRDENAGVFRRHYRRGDRDGAVPAHILERWRLDVGERETPRLVDTTATSNIIVVHRRHRRFLERLRDQVRKVIPAADAGTWDDRSEAYRMTDESVLNSLLLFSDLAPDTSPFVLGDVAGPHLAHFVGHPKPWLGWRRRSWYCYEPIQDLVRWAGVNGFAIPPRGRALRRAWKPVYWSLAHGRWLVGSARAATRRAQLALLPRRSGGAAAATPAADDGRHAAS